MENVAKHNPYLDEITNRKYSSWNFVDSEESLAMMQLLNLIQSHSRINECKMERVNDPEFTLYHIDESAVLLLGPIKVLIYDPEFDYLKLLNK